MTIPPACARPWRRLTRFFAVIGMATSAMLIAGLTLDMRAFDQTRGGYEPPYTDYTGTPIDWRRMDTTADGMVYRGHVVDLLLDCRSGMMTVDAFGLEKQWRRLSPRALAVHKPREECRARGFVPQF